MVATVDLTAENVARFCKERMSGGGEFCNGLVIFPLAVGAAGNGDIPNADGGIARGVIFAWVFPSSGTV